MRVTGNISQKHYFLDKNHQKIFYKWCHVQSVLVSTHFLNSFFHEYHARCIHSQYFCDPVKQKRHQTQVRAPPWERLMATSWHTLYHLPIQSPPHLEKNYNSSGILFSEAQVYNWQQHWVELAFQRFLKFEPAEPRALNLSVLCFRIFWSQTTQYPSCFYYWEGA